jgi:hypothetical protein
LETYLPARRPSNARWSHTKFAAAFSALKGIGFDDFCILECIPLSLVKTLFSTIGYLRRMLQMRINCSPFHRWLSVVETHAISGAADIVVSCGQQFGSLHGSGGENSALARGQRFISHQGDASQVHRHLTRDDRSTAARVFIVSPLFASAH